MAKYVIFVPPAHGHVNPTFGVAAELVARGEEVVYVTTEGFRAEIEATGARLKAHPDPAPIAPGPGSGPTALFGLLTETARTILPWLPEWLAAQQPDLVLCDPMAIWGTQEADRQGFPVNTLYVSYLAGKVTQEMFGGQDANAFVAGVMASDSYREFAELFGTTAAHHPFESFTRSDLSGISFMPREFHPRGDEVGPEILFAGPSIRTRAYTGDFPLSEIENANTLFISLGTVFNQRPEFFRSCFEAFGSRPGKVVLSHGTRVDPADLGTPPANFLLAPSVPQLSVLERTDVFVTHGGMNSTQEALYYGVPLVVIPQMPEQALTARRVDELGLGIALDPAAATAEALADAVRTIEADPSYAARVADMRKHSHAAGGPSAAADLLMKRARA